MGRRFEAHLLISVLITNSINRKSISEWFGFALNYIKIRSGLVSSFLFEFEILALKTFLPPTFIWKAKNEYQAEFGSAQVIATRRKTTSSYFYPRVSGYGLNFRKSLLFEEFYNL